MVLNASAADMGSVQGAASLTVLKKAMDQEASTAAELIAALPQPPYWAVVFSSHRRAGPGRRRSGRRRSGRDADAGAAGDTP